MNRLQNSGGDVSAICVSSPVPDTIKVTAQSVAVTVIEKSVAVLVKEKSELSGVAHITKKPTISTVIEKPAVPNVIEKPASPKVTAKTVFISDKPVANSLKETPNSSETELKNTVEDVKEPEILTEPVTQVLIIDVNTSIDEIEPAPVVEFGAIVLGFIDKVGLEIPVYDPEMKPLSLMLDKIDLNTYGIIATKGECSRIGFIIRIHLMC